MDWGSCGAGATALITAACGHLNSILSRLRPQSAIDLLFPQFLSTLRPDSIDPRFFQASSESSSSGALRPAADMAVAGGDPALAYWRERLRGSSPQIQLFPPGTIKEPLSH